MATNVSEWTPSLVEDLLFRQFMKNEDVSSSIPPTPRCDPDAYLQNYDHASRMMLHYVRNGPQPAPLGAQNPNTASHHQMLKSAASSASVTPVKHLYSQPPPLALNHAAAGHVSTNPKTPSAKSLPAAPLLQPEGAKGVQPTRTPKSTLVASVKDAIPPPMPQLMASQPPPSPTSAAASLVSKRERPMDPVTPKGKKVRIDWPADVPTNAALKSKSRSAVAHLTSQRVRAQQCFDPDLVFLQPKGELPLHTIFADFPKALKAIAAIRGISGDWRDDTFTQEEEAQYKSDVGIEYFGSSQCLYGQLNGTAGSM